MKHTPGPWHVMKGWDERSWMVDSANGTPIAAVSDTRLNARENARLIAAAPELLAALKGLIQEEFVFENAQSPNIRAVVSRRVNAALAAIAKAEGK